jgi:glucosyl-3-phosphoglycerate synthase
VETSHLIDVYTKWGMEAIAQVDLDQRVHRNQETRDLGKMAFGILRAFLYRAEALGVIGTLPELSTVLKQFQAHDEEFEQVSHTIVEEERPPMIELPEYRKKFKIG